MQNGPHEYAVDHTSFYVISKLFTQTFLIGRGDVTFLHIAYVKSTKNVGKLTCVFGRFKNPFFLWLIQILKAVTMIMVTAIAFFWSFMRNPAIPLRATDVCMYVSDLELVCTTQLFYTYFCNHAHRLRLEKPLCLELSRSSNGF